MRWNPTVPSSHASYEGILGDMPVATGSIVFGPEGAPGVEGPLPLQIMSGICLHIQNYHFH